MKIKFESLCPVLFCRYIGEKKRDGEEDQAFEERIWKQRAHYDNKGNVIVPGYLIQSTLEPAAELLDKRVGGKKMGKSLKHYLRLVTVIGDITTNITQGDLEGNTAFVASNGQKLGPKVPRTYPKVDKWSGVLTVVYPDMNQLNKEIILENFVAAGLCVGIGHWRPGAPSKGGYGKFSVEKVE